MPNDFLRIAGELRTLPAQLDAAQALPRPDNGRQMNAVYEHGGYLLAEALDHGAMADDAQIQAMRRQFAPAGAARRLDLFFLAVVQHCLAQRPEHRQRLQATGKVKQERRGKVNVSVPVIRPATRLADPHKQALTLLADLLEHQGSAPLPILSPDAGLVLEILRELKPHQGLTAPQIIDEFGKRHPEHKILDESRFRKDICRELKPYGIDHQPRLGYRILTSGGR